MELKNKIVVITGGSKGLGKALAISLIKEGSSVIISSNNKEQLDSTAKEIGVSAIVADVTKESEVRNLAEKVVADFGKIDIWVNNAGVMYSFPKDLLIDMDKAHNIFDVNFFGVVFGCRTAFKSIANNDGIIMTINSSSGLDATRASNYKLYAASKWAVRGFIQAFIAEHIESKVKNIIVYPGGIKTELYPVDKPNNFNDFMEPSYVSNIIIENLKKENPEEELIIKRPKI